MRISGPRRALVGLATLPLLGLLAVLAPRLDDWRRDPVELAVPDVLHVVSGRDAGPGSLREAIFAANAAGRRTRIVLRVGRVQVLTTLPALVGRHGTVLEGESGDEEIDATRLGEGPVVDLLSPSSSLRRLRLRGAPEAAIVVRAPGVRVEGVTVVHSGTAVLALAPAGGLRVEDCRFERNRIGIRVEGGSGPVLVEANRFQAHREAGIWAVRAPDSGGVPPTLRIAGNRFEADGHAVVAANVDASIEDNDFVRSGTAAIYLGGIGASVRGNRIRRGGRTGILAAGSVGARITGNEIDHNEAVGLLLNREAATVVEGNRIYGNGYGIVVVSGQRELPALLADNQVSSQRYDGVFVAGASPILRRNRLLANAAAGLRVLDLLDLDRDTREESRPLLDGNRLESNGIDQVIYGVLELERAEGRGG